MISDYEMRNFWIENIQLEVKEPKSEETTGIENELKPVEQDANCED